MPSTRVARTYIERIEIRGNARTRDFVIRREFDVSEGDAFNQVLIQRAKRRLEKLNFFETVNISTAPGSEPDQVILVVDLVEKSTGELSIGAGYTTGGETPGPSLEGSITERNFLGRGQFIRFAAGAGRNSRDFTFSFTEPYFLGRRIAAGFDVLPRRAPMTTTGARRPARRFASVCRSPQALTTQTAYTFAQEEYEFDDDCSTIDMNPNRTKCDVSQAIIEGVLNSPWNKSAVSGSIDLQYDRRH